MGVGSSLYNFVLLLHLVAVIIGFGSVALAGAFGAEARARQGREGLAIAEATSRVTSRYSEWFIYAVPILGIILVFLSDDTWKFSQTWISLSFLLYFAMLGILHGVLLPNIRRMNGLMAQLAGGGGAGAAGASGASSQGGGSAGGQGGQPPQVAELEERSKKTELFRGVVNLLWVATLALMIWKPGV